MKLDYKKQEKKLESIFQPENFHKKLSKLFYQDTGEKRVLRKKLSQLLDGRTFLNGLDVGPGPGLITQPLYDRCQSLTLVELLPIYEKMLCKKFPNANVLIESISDFSPKNKFDIILCSHVLYYFDKQSIDSVLTKLITSLNPEGILILILLDCDFILQYFNDKLNHLFGVNFIDIKTIGNKLSKLGKVEFWEYFFDKKFKNKEEFNHYLFNFLSIKKESDFLTCTGEINRITSSLENVKNKYVLQQHGKILIYKKINNIS